MNRFFLIISLFISSITNAQLTVTVLDITTNDLLYDTITERIYVTIPSSNGSNGNSIGIINPNTCKLENTIYMGSEPTIMAISSNGQFIYTGFEGTNTVRKFIVSSQQADEQFTLGSDEYSGPFYAYDISVMPDQPNTVAISRIVHGSTGFYGTAIYDSGIVRPINTNTSYPNYYSYLIRFYNKDTLFAYNNVSTGYDFNRLLVDNEGVTEVFHSSDLVQELRAKNFVFNNNKVFYDYGSVIDINDMDAPFLAGTFSEANGRVAIDQYKNRICFATFDTYQDNIVFKSYIPETYLLEYSQSISEASGEVLSFVTCGQDCYAFNTSENQVIILKGDITRINDINSEKYELTINPNPVKESFIIQSSTNIKIDKAIIYDMSGRQVVNLNPIDSELIDISNLQTGIYLIKIIYIDGMLVFKKIIKR